MFVILSVPNAIFSQLFHIKVCGELALNEIEVEATGDFL
jgi:hypothetical protein